MLLATHTEIQEKVFEELKEVFYSEDVEINYDNLNKLDLLERVIKESLRLCPVVPSEYCRGQLNSLTIYCPQNAINLGFSEAINHSNIECLK
jgi:cytochrome P450